MGMMIAIKDFEMPRYCVTCDICRSDDGENLYCGITHSDVIDLYHRQTDCPLVEAIPKADYEARLKADMAAILVELQLKIEELRLDRPLFSRGFECYGYEDKTPIEIRQECSDIIQEKINSLRGGENEENG